MAKSEYLETLEKLQNALTQFDMSFGVSNRIFRLALVSEILDTACLFEQLHESWSKYLPYGEGPDSDIDFAYWKNLSSWEMLLDSAKQNACIDDFPLDMGNGLTSDRINGNRRKSYLKTVNSVLRRSKYAGKESTSAFVKTINSDNTHMITFGNMVFDALTPLLLVLSKIDDLLSNPPQELFQNYYEQQRERFKGEIDTAKLKIKDLMRESIAGKRKINRLKEMRDGIIGSLRESGFLTDLKTAYTHYDIEDYRDDNNCPELSDDIVLEQLVLEDLLTGDKQFDIDKIAKYIYEHRKTLNRDAIATFYIYAEVSPEIERLLDILKDYDTKHEVKEENHGDTVVEAIHAQTEMLKKIVSEPNVVINELVVNKHVDNEVGHVDKGATGITINKKDE